MLPILLLLGACFEKKPEETPSSPELENEISQVAKHDGDFYLEQEDIDNYKTQLSAYSHLKNVFGSSYDLRAMRILFIKSVIARLALNSGFLNSQKAAEIIATITEHVPVDQYEKLIPLLKEVSDDPDQLGPLVCICIAFDSMSVNERRVKAEKKPILDDFKNRMSKVIQLIIDQKIIIKDLSEEDYNKEAGRFSDAGVYFPQDENNKRLPEKPTLYLRGKLNMDDWKTLTVSSDAILHELIHVTQFIDEEYLDPEVYDEEYEAYLTMARYQAYGLYEVYDKPLSELDIIWDRKQKVSNDTLAVLRMTEKVSQPSIFSRKGEMQKYSEAIKPNSPDLRIKKMWSYLYWKVQENGVPIPANEILDKLYTSTIQEERNGTTACDEACFKDFYQKTRRQNNSNSELVLLKSGLDELSPDVISNRKSEAQTNQNAASPDTVAYGKADAAFRIYEILSLAVDDYEKAKMKADQDFIPWLKGE